MYFCLGRERSSRPTWPSWFPWSGCKYMFTCHICCLNFGQEVLDMSILLLLNSLVCSRSCSNYSYVCFALPLVLHYRSNLLNLLKACVSVSLQSYCGCLFLWFTFLCFSLWGRGRGFLKLEWIISELSMTDVVSRKPFSLSSFCNLVCNWRWSSSC